MATQKINIRDINPLEHLTSDLAKARFNYESILKGLVEWNASKLDNVTVRLMCDTEPGFVDYTFPTKQTAVEQGANIADPYSTENSYSYEYRYPMSALVAEDRNYSDELDVRISVLESADAAWRLCVSAVLYDEQWITSYLSSDTNTSVLHDSASDGSEGRIIVHDGADVTSTYIRGQFIRLYYPETAYGSMKWVSTRINTGSSILDNNTKNVVERWSLDRVNEYRNANTMEYLFVVHEGKVYRPTGTINRMAPSVPASGWEYFCDVYSPDAGLKRGHVYLYDPNPEDIDYKYSEFFIYTNDDTMYAYPPYEIEAGGDVSRRTANDGWTESSVLLFPITSSFKTTNAVRWSATTDIESLVALRTSVGSTDKSPDIQVLPTVRIMGGTTEDNGGFKIFDTSNYSQWPGTAPKWSLGRNYSTDPEKGINDLQNYTATMVFDHANPDCKAFNIINYDGPDLDQGLVIYLPVESTIDGKVVYPNNGRTFEFMFRIWPNPAYNGHETADLIINKAQVYVYNVASADNLKVNATPLAKFSMARLTNFYVFSENIAVPNRPVIVRAKFVYSADEHMWKTYDYYQMPDCIFLSPNGFVDPGRPSDDTYGVETAGFPLVQDPFSDYNLSPVMVDDTFRNRID
jgi:hypothetical protein